MEDGKNILIIIMLILSAVAFFVPIIIRLVKRIFRRVWRSTRKKSGLSRMLIFTIHLIGAIWCLRYAVGYYNLANSESDVFGLTAFEVLFSSLLNTLQTFSMDESYTESVINIKNMAEQLFAGQLHWATILGIYSSVLNIIAPVAGGAVIFAIIASVSPKVKLYFYHHIFWRDKYYFSELNEASVTLAKSIFEKKHPLFKRPVLIFTDVFVDDEKEIDSELLIEAKLIGAICVKDDFAHVKKNKFGARQFFIMDTSESGNLQALINLSNSYNSRYLKNALVYYFTDNDAYVQVEDNIRKKLSSKESGFDNNELPVLIPVNGYRNLISDLLVKVPLYEPIVGKKKNADGSLNLNVTIVGAGAIGTEMFLSAYWIGQMLNCNLEITVVSEESEEAFWDKIDHINPEIRETTSRKSKILEFNGKGDKQDIYCQVKYISCDAYSTKFVECLSGAEDSIADTDYFFVSLGADDKNISVANIIKKYIGIHHIKQAKEYRSGSNGVGDWPCGKTVITYVVYNSEVAETLNQKQNFSSLIYNDDEDYVPDIFMEAVGSLKDVYSDKDVSLSEYAESERKLYDLYIRTQYKEDMVKTHKKRTSNDYNHWANIARAMHTKYKMFSIGIIKHSRFLCKPKEYNGNFINKAYKEYISMVQPPKNPSLESECERITLLHKLAWLEHRRWNAFTRIKGFRHTDDYEVYAVKCEIGSYKNMELKLHPCLLECGQGGIAILEEPHIKKNFQCGNLSSVLLPKEQDLLDELSIAIREKQYNDYTFKQYDYPIIDVVMDENNEPTEIAETIELPKELEEAVHIAAVQNHEEWMQRQSSKGWKRGDRYDKDAKTDPKMVPFNELDQEDQDDKKKSAKMIFRLALSLGCTLQNPDKKS